MRFPMIRDIATTAVISIDVNKTVADALDVMLHQEHRSIVITDKKMFKLFTVIDILEIKDKKISLDTPLYKLNLQSMPTIKKYQNVLETLEYLAGSVEFIAVLNEDDSLFGIVTHTDITHNIDPETLMENYRLADFIKLGRRMKWVKKEEKTSKILSEMVRESFDNVIIIDDLVPLGILTTKDIMRLIVENQNLDFPVCEYMSSPVDTVNKNVSIKTALEFLKSKKYKRIVAVDDEGVISGIVSQKELISLTYSRWAMLMKEHEAELNEINILLQSQNKEFETMASTDALTGLFNRYKFSELFVSTYKTMMLRDSKMSLILLDIDFFKKVNDTYGHNNGDRVLVKVAHALHHIIRNIDIVCRWGGEEFVVLLPTASIENAIAIAEKIRMYVENMEIPEVGKITISCGVSEVECEENMKRVIERADKALYLAKNSGRNCVKSELDI
ncbi:MAG: diguanylate cyclase [Sulfurimonas sp.]|nr:diguanylate cyclase [Sulfurimonas sp.]MBU3938619.1 diguanylate cyclase [bacterium]MBU4024686.1 diguanylate cyclase [bacterium]MBU4059545.1 diguanylate cyclase [bacterium]MBU4110975.1 diguanylate cyclase [bacterium]